MTEGEIVGAVLGMAERVEATLGIAEGKRVGAALELAEGVERLYWG